MLEVGWGFEATKCVDMLFERTLLFWEVSYSTQISSSKKSSCLDQNIRPFPSCTCFTAPTLAYTANFFFILKNGRRIYHSHYLWAQIPIYPDFCGVRAVPSQKKNPKNDCECHKMFVTPTFLPFSNCGSFGL